jgi:hypothetical protein
MSLQIVFSFIVMLLIGLPAAASECKSELVGLTAYFYSRGDEWSISWRPDGVHKGKAIYYSNLKEGSRTNVYDSQGDKRSESLPQTLLNPDKQFNVPFDISQNGKFLIAAIHERSYMSYPSKHFAIVDLKKRKIVQTIDAEYSIRSLAWAPEGKYFAVLYAQEVTKQVFKGPLDWLTSLVGHPISYYTFYLTIYRPDGMLLCTEQIEKKLPNAMGYIDWEKQ